MHSLPMDAAHTDLETIRRILADVITRVQNIERKLGIEGAMATELPPAAQSPPPLNTVPVDLLHRPAIPHEPAKATSTGSKPPAPPCPLIPDSPLTHAQPTYARTDSDLESRIGSHWLNRIGISALLIGMAYFLKFAFDNNWIGPAGRVAIGLFAGVAVIAWSERFRAKGYRAFSYSLKALGIGALYLSLWGAFQVYALISNGVAFLAMFVVTAATAGMAWAEDSQLLAAFALAGGFVTPILLSTGENREAALFGYVLLLDSATLVLVRYKPWHRLPAMSFAGTLFLYVGWYSRFYDRSQLSATLAFATLFWVIFAAAPLVSRQGENETAGLAIPPILAFVNAAAYFLQAYAVIDAIDRSYMACFTAGLSVVYILLSRQTGKRTSNSGPLRVLHYLHLAIGLGLITIAIPIRLDAHWITIGWFVEAGILLWVADRIHSDLLNVFALAALLLGVLRLLLIDDFYTTQIILNTRFATYMVAVAVLGAVAFFAAKRGDDAGRQVTAGAVIALNLLSLAALSHEVADYYGRLLGTVRPPFRGWTRAYASEWRRIHIERDFTYSALWMGYGALLMIVGFARRSAFVRWQALVLIAATIFKVFIYDVSQLDRGYRIVSFIILGVLLLAISFVYQRDWLQLSNRVGRNSSA